MSLTVTSSGSSDIGTRSVSAKRCSRQMSLAETIVNVAHAGHPCTAGQCGQGNCGLGGGQHVAITDCGQQKLQVAGQNPQPKERGPLQEDPGKEAH